MGLPQLHAVDKVFRELDVPLTGSKISVLGYGKIGRGVALAAKENSCLPIVLECDPIRRIQALSDGFPIPEPDDALRFTNLALGCTGAMSLSENVLTKLPDLSFVASVSSKKVEIDVGFLSRFQSFRITDHVVAHSLPNGNRILLINNGQPVNFLVNSVSGPLISLVQGGIVIGLKAQFSGLDVGLHELTSDVERLIASSWCSSFVQGETGHYCREILS